MWDSCTTCCIYNYLSGIMLLFAGYFCDNLLHQCHLNAYHRYLVYLEKCICYIIYLMFWKSYVGHQLSISRVYFSVYDHSFHIIICWLFHLSKTGISAYFLYYIAFRLVCKLIFCGQTRNLIKHFGKIKVMVNTYQSMNYFSIEIFCKYYIVCNTNNRRKYYNGFNWRLMVTWLSKPHTLTYVARVMIF